MKSIKEFAEELEVSEKTVSRYIKRLKIKPKMKGTKHLIDEDAQQLIRQTIADISGIVDGQSGQNKTDSKDKQDNETQPQTAHSQTYKQTPEQDTVDIVADNKKANADSKKDNAESVELYKLRCEMLQNQVDLMQRQIDSLNNDKEQLYRQLDNLTNALTAAQAIHGMDKQQKLLEVDADAQEQGEPPQKKKNFFSRMFGKDKR